MEINEDTCLLLLHKLYKFDESKMLLKRPVDGDDLQEILEIFATGMATVGSAIAAADIADFCLQCRSSVENQGSCHSGESGSTNDLAQISINLSD